MRTEVDRIGLYRRPRDRYVGNEQAAVLVGRAYDLRPEHGSPMTLDGRSRWLSLYVLCLGDLMIVLDSTIVNVALPSIRADLGFSETSLAWVVNAYLLTFGGFLLLGGRLGDLFGHRRLFLGGITLFTLASLACGLATSQEFLIAARAVQGLGGAVVSVVALADHDPVHRAR
jgi:predicted MFS family arabinose efflux permease